MVVAMEMVSPRPVFISGAMLVAQTLNVYITLVQKLYEWGTDEERIKYINNVSVKRIPLSRLLKIAFGAKRACLC